MTTLILHLSEADSMWSFYLQGSGEPKLTPIADKQSLADQLAQQPTVHALIPGEAIRIAKIKVPKNLSLRELEDSVPYMLEEQLLSDIETTHCWVLEKTADDVVAVAIFSKAKIKAWLTQLDNKNINADQIYPDYFALPWQEQTWYVFHLDDRILVRTEKNLGFCISISECGELFPLLLTKENKPEKIISNHPNQTIETLAHTLKIEFEIAVIHFPDNAASPFNFLQKDYKKQDFHLKKLLVKTSIGITFAALILQIILHGYQFFHWFGLNHSAEQTIKTAYLKVNPNETDFRGVALRVESELNRLGGIPYNSNFIRLMHAITQIIQTENGTQLKQLDYHDKALHLLLEVPDFSSLERIKKQIATHGVHVKQDSATTQDQIVRAQLVIQ